uniref:Uncharacterized protein n=1 Tax=Oryza punctata TaxID=4537 RepID=A0A0E0LCL0_ORYPU
MTHDDRQERSSVATDGANGGDGGDRVVLVLRELEGHNLTVDCTGEGVLFIEADVDVRLEHFGDALKSSFLLEGLMFDVLGSLAVLGSSLQLHHTMKDAQGLVQFLGVIVNARDDKSDIDIPEEYYGATAAPGHRRHIKGLVSEYHQLHH